MQTDLISHINSNIEPSFFSQANHLQVLLKLGWQDSAAMCTLEIPAQAVRCVVTSHHKNQFSQCILLKAQVIPKY